MKYINGNDFPFEIKQMLLESLERKEPIIITTISGQLVAMPMDQYNQMKSAANGGYSGSTYRSEEEPSSWLDEMDFMERDEVDY